jgi:hypothetical protein
MRKVFVVLASAALSIAFLQGVAASRDARSNADEPNAPWNARGVLLHSFTYTQVSPNGGEQPNSPPPSPNPGDQRTNQWFDQQGDLYFEHSETDRWQRSDAPHGGDPNDGSGVYEWVLIHSEMHSMSDEECSKMLHVHCQAT